MVQNKRDYSFTLCKGFISEAFNKYDNIKTIKFEIIDVYDNFIKTNITINEKTKIYDISLTKKNRNINPMSRKNLKNQKNSNLSLNIEGKNTASNEIIITNKVDETQRQQLKLENKKLLNNIKNEKDINIKENMDDNSKFIPEDKNISKLNNENKKCIKKIEDVNSKSNIDILNNDIINDEDDFDESEPENFYDYQDPFFKKHPELFKCYDCYQTNVENKELFDVAQEYIDKYNDIENKYIKLKEEILIKEKQIKKYKEKQQNSIYDPNFISELNDKFIDLIKIVHKSFDNTNNILKTLESNNPKKIPEIVNKNIFIYRKNTERIADEADIIRKEFLKLNNEINDSFNINL